MILKLHIATFPFIVIRVFGRFITNLISPFTHCAQHGDGYMRYLRGYVGRWYTVVPQVWGVVPFRGNSSSVSGTIAWTGIWVNVNQCT